MTRLSAASKALHNAHIDWRLEPGDDDPLKTVHTTGDVQLAAGKVTAARTSEYYLHRRTDTVVIGTRAWTRAPWDDCWGRSWREFALSGAGGSDCIQASAGGLRHELAVFSPTTAATYVHAAKTVTRSGRDSFTLHVETEKLPDSLGTFASTEVDISIVFTASGRLSKVKISEQDGGDVSTYTVAYSRQNAVSPITAP